MKKTLIQLFILACATTANAQVKKLPSGLEINYIKKGNGTQKAKAGDYINCFLKASVSGKKLLDTKDMNKGQNLPVNFPLTAKKFNGDVQEALMHLVSGDSVIIKIPQDSFFRAQKPPYVKPGDAIIYNCGVVNIKTAAQFKKEQEDYKKAMAAFQKQQADFKKAQALAKKIIRIILLIQLL